MDSGQSWLRESDTTTELIVDVKHVPPEETSDDMKQSKGPEAELPGRKQKPIRTRRILMLKCAGKNGGGGIRALPRPRKSRPVSWREK